MSGINLWFDLEEMEDEENDNDLYEGEDLSRELPDIEDEDIICRECGAVVEDGYQCQICGLVVEVV